MVRLSSHFGSKKKGVDALRKTKLITPLEEAKGGEESAVTSKQAAVGNLRMLQDKVKRDPDGYKDDVILQLKHCESQIALFQITPNAANKELCQTLTFLSHVVPLYKDIGGNFATDVIGLLQKHKDSLDAEVRRCMVQCLCLLRSRNAVDPQQVLPLFFQLFKVKDRELRETLLAFLVADVKRMNAKTKNPQVNRQLQNFMYQFLAEDDPIAGRHALWVILDLYRRGVWTDDRVVNVVAQACFSKHTKLLTMALRFFLGHFPKDMDQEDEEEEEEVPQKKKGKNVAKKTKARKTAKDKEKKQKQRALKRKDIVSTVFKPVEVLNDPQGFAEKLFAQLTKTKERFNVRMLHVALLAKVISTHDVVLLNLYPYLQRYMEPHQQHVTHILAYTAQCVHSLIPPESLHSLMMTIANHFVSDKASPDAIAIGINTLREICRRQPLVMTEDLLQDIAQYKRFKRDKGVVMASRSMIQLFRELQPDMLARKDRGREADLEKKMHTFGTKVATATEIPGLELLEEYYKEKQEKKEQLLKEREERRAKATGSQAAEEEDEDEDDEDEEEDEWEEASLSDGGSDSWISVSDSEEIVSDDEDADAPEKKKEEEEEDCEMEEVEEVEEVEEDDEDSKESGEEGFQVVEDTEGGRTTTREELMKKEEESKIEAGRLAETKFLTQRDFQLMRELAEKKANEDPKLKKKSKKRTTEEAELGEEVTVDTLEAYSNRKRKRDAEEKRVHTEAVRERYKARNKVNKKGGGTTNKQKRKGKLSTMVMQSRSVQARKYETGSMKKKRNKISKKRNTKFRIRRGGH